MPETRASGASSQVARNAASRIVSRSSCARTSWRPVRQVVMIVNMTIPIANENQPPVGIFSEFDPNNARSTIMIGISKAAIVGHRHRQTLRMTAPMSTVVRVIVPVTAKP